MEGMNSWCRDVFVSNRSCFSRICPSLRSDILLGGNGNYKYDYSGSLCGPGLILMAMGGVYCRGPNSETVFRVALFTTLCDCAVFRHPFGAPS